MNWRLFLIGIIFIISSLFVSASPHCSNGIVGDIELNISLMDYRGDFVVWGPDKNWNTHDIQVEFSLNNSENRSMDIVINGSLLNSSGEVILTSYVYEWIGPFEERRDDLRFDSENYNFTAGNYTVILKAYEKDNESFNCNEKEEEFEFVLSRVLRILNFTTSPEILECGETEFSVDIELKNVGLGDLTNIETMVSGDDLNLLHLFPNQSLNVNESINLSITFELPGFHLYRHEFFIWFGNLSKNFHDVEGFWWCGNSFLACDVEWGDEEIIGWGKDEDHPLNARTYLVIEKCPTDNANDIREEIPKLKSAVEKIREKIRELFACLLSNGISC